MRNRIDNAKYLNPYTDFGFNKLFGTEMNKELLISFINALFDGKEVVRDLTYLNREYKEARDLKRKAVFDVYCENEKGEKILVEMQRGDQPFFKAYSLEEATPFFREQAECGDRYFPLKAIYVIGILNFTFEDDNSCIHQEVCLRDRYTGHVFGDKLTFLYLEIPKFNKTEPELDGMLDKWLFVLRNLSGLQERPLSLQEHVFTHLFASAEIGQLIMKEYEVYLASLNAYRDSVNVIRTAELKGRTKGLEEGRKTALLAIAARMQAKGMDISTICELTGLSPEDLRWK